MFFIALKSSCNERIFHSEQIIMFRVGTIVAGKIMVGNHLPDFFSKSLHDLIQSNQDNLPASRDVEIFLSTYYFQHL